MWDRYYWRLYFTIIRKLNHQEAIAGKNYNLRFYFRSFLHFTLSFHSSISCPGPAAYLNPKSFCSPWDLTIATNILTRVFQQVSIPKPQQLFSLKSRPRKHSAGAWPQSQYSRLSPCVLATDSDYAMPCFSLFTLTLLSDNFYWTFESQPRCLVLLEKPPISPHSIQPEAGNTHPSPKSFHAIPLDSTLP